MSGQQQTRRPETAPQEETPSGAGGLLGTLTNWVSQLGATAGNAAAAAAITPQTAPTVHTVARGDTLGAIAKKYGTTTAALQQANNIRDPSRIAIGQKITIPQGTGAQGNTTGQQQTTGQQTTGQQTTGQQTAAAGPVTVNGEALQKAVDAAIGVAPADMQDGAKKCIPGILRQCAQAGMKSSAQTAYVLATAQHESSFGLKRYSRSESFVEDRNPFKEETTKDKKTGKTTKTGKWTSTVHTNGAAVKADSQEQLEIDYWDSAYGGKLGNVSGTTDARDFRGRGFVQLTGRDNFKKMGDLLTKEGFTYTQDEVTYGGQGNPAIDLLAHPDHVNKNMELAARLMIIGMQQGSFTGKKIGDYVNENGTDFTNARRVINGDTAKNGEHIGEIATSYNNAISSLWAPVFEAAPTTAPAPETTPTTASNTGGGPR